MPEMSPTEVRAAIAREAARRWNDDHDQEQKDLAARRAAAAARDGGAK